MEIPTINVEFVEPWPENCVNNAFCDDEKEKVNEVNFKDKNGYNSNGKIEESINETSKSSAEDNECANDIQTGETSREILSSEHKVNVTDNQSKHSEKVFDHSFLHNIKKLPSDDEDEEEDVGLWFKGHTPIPSDESGDDGSGNKIQMEKILAYEHQYALPVITEPINNLSNQKLVHNDVSYDESDFSRHRSSSQSLREKGHSHKKKRKKHKRKETHASVTTESGKDDISSFSHSPEKEDAMKRRTMTLDSIIPPTYLPKIKETKESIEELDVSDRRPSLPTVLTPKLTEKQTPKRHHHHKHHHKHRHRRHKGMQLQDTLESRIRTGMQTLEDERRAIKELQEEIQHDFREEDINDIKSHRLGHFGGIRRQSKRHRFVKSGMTTHMSLEAIPQSSKKEMPHVHIDMDGDQLQFAPKEGFVELEELVATENNEFQWKERARWIKFEEDIEKNERWGKPHVASLSFQSLLEMRRGIENGTVLLNLENYDLPTIFESVVENMIITDQVRFANREKLIMVLLSKHCHQHQRTGSVLQRRFSITSLSMSESGEKDGRQSEEEGEEGIEMTKVQRQWSTDSYGLSKKQGSIESTNDIDGTFFHKQHVTASNNGFKASQDDHFLKVPNVKFAPIMEAPKDDNPTKVSDVKTKIPQGAEATSVLVATIEELDKPAMAFVRLAKGCFLGNLTEVKIPIRFLFVIIGPPSNHDNYEIGRSIATLMSDKIFHDLAYTAKTRDDLLAAINSFLDDSIVLAPGDWDRHLLLPLLQAEITEKKKQRIKLLREKATFNPPDDEPFLRTSSPFGGLKRDLKKKSRFYMSDFVDGFNLRCFVTIIFVFFATLAPTITFGALLSKKTDHNLGAMETLIATSICGILFSLFSGQPLIILGTTGPILVFEEATYMLCQYFEIDFLIWRLYIGLMVMVILWVVVALEGCFLVEYFTRFTEEVFSVLISLLFIYEAFNFVIASFKDNKLKSGVDSLGFNTSSPLVSQVGPACHNQANIALISSLLVIGTFFIAHKLRQLRNSHFLSSKARRVLSDFGVPFAMIAMVLVNLFTHDIDDVPKIKMPHGIRPTSRNRTVFFVNPVGGNIGPGWIAFAILPAICVSILLFMETELTGVLLNKRKNKLRKSGGYNLDLFVMGALTGLCSLMGLPWMCAGTVRSVQHQNALAILSRTHAPGERPYLVQIKEQRLTNLCIHILIGGCIFAEPLITNIPLAVCFGVFTYLGISSLSGIQFIEQLKLIFVPMKYHPNRKYVRCVRFRSLVTYTLIQILCLGVLIAIKLSPAAPMFPFFIIGMVFLRRFIEKLYNEDELQELDNEDDDDEFEEIDEYGTSLPM